VGQFSIAIRNAGFFFRYASNLAAGEGFTFNAGGDPTLGVSSILWCFLLAMFAWIGFPPDQAHLPLGILFTAVAAGIMCLAAARRFGPPAAAAIAVMLLSNGRFLSWASQGMETSLGFVLVAAGLASVLDGRRNPLTLGVLAGLCVLHKLDMAVFAFGLIVFARPTDSTVPDFSKSGLRAKVIAAAIAILILGTCAAWAEARFGSPLPLSVARKIGREHGAVDATWFVQEALIRDGGKRYTLLALAGIWCLRTQPQVAFLALMHIGSHVAAYTIRPPAEPYSWYPVQLQPSLNFLAGIGLFGIAQWCAVRWAHTQAAARAVVWMSPLLVGLGISKKSQGYHGARRQWSEQVEAHRIAAGRWLAENTPRDARIATGFGLPSYYSQRFILDWSGLTREHIEHNAFFRTTDPDFVATCAFQTGVTPATFRPRRGYRVVEFFGPTRASTSTLDFFTVILERHVE